MVGTPPRVWPLIELELRDKNELVALDETKPKVPEVLVLGQLVTSQVGSVTSDGRLVFRQ